MKRTQRTIKSPVEITGVGLHTGEEVTVTFKPSDPDTGVTFVRLDLEEQPRIPAHIDNVSRNPAHAHWNSPFFGLIYSQVRVILVENRQLSKKTKSVCSLQAVAQTEILLSGH